MNREIKFRVWLSDRKIMLYPTDNLHLVGINGAVTLRLENWYQDYENRDYYVNGSNIIQQFTGLKDKTGREIYEGDIVKDLDNENGVIEFNNGSFIIKSKIVIPFWSVLELNGLVLPRVIKSDAFEIIGNIFENKDLLE